MKRLILISALLITAALAQGQQRYEVTHIDSNINTTGSETGAVIVDDSLVLYTSMQNADANRLYLIDFTPTLTQIFQAPIAPDGKLGDGKLNLWGLNSNSANCGNVSFDAKNDILYFTRSESTDNTINHIYYSCRKQGRWSKPQPMGGDINQKGYTSTHPAVGYLPDGKTILYFSSDRPGGIGGMDIWYAIIIQPGKPGNSTNLGAPINTDSNEVTPFYSNEEGFLYYSSNCEGGQGGFDIYYSEGLRNSWQLPHNLGKEVNTHFDDLFFTIQSCRCRCVQEHADTTEQIEACGFLASNRHGSLFKSDSNCCNDLFRWRRLRRPDSVTPPKPELPQETSPLALLPLSLYFHNDEPTPCTLDTTTNLDYSATWRHYMQRKAEYSGAQPSPADHRKWDSVQAGVEFFFEHQLRKGHSDMIVFLNLLYQDLKAGRKVCITVNGFASPLFEDMYNVNLSKRRIDSFRNELRHWNDEALLPFLNNGNLKLETVAFGAPNTNEVAPSDPLRNPKSMKAIYSIEAARDRRIDIIDYKYCD